MHTCVFIYVAAVTQLMNYKYICVYWLQVIAYNKVVANAQKSANQNQSIGHYAVPKETVDKSKEHEVGICMHGNHEVQPNYVCT